MPIGDLVDEFGAWSLLLTDMRVARILVNEGRYRALERLGVRREDANMATLVMAMMLADSAARRLQWVLGLRIHPTRYDALLAGGVANELLHDLGGPSSRQTRYFAALIALAVLTGSPGPTLKRTFKDLGSFSHRSALGFHQRYGYLIAARARRAAAAARSATAPSG